MNPYRNYYNNMDSKNPRENQQDKSEIHDMQQYPPEPAFIPGPSGRYPNHPGYPGYVPPGSVPPPPGAPQHPPQRPHEDRRDDRNRRPDRDRRDRDDRDRRDHRDTHDRSKPSGPPPSHTPERRSSVFAVDPGSLDRCLYHYTYIWLNNGQSFWMYPIQAGYRSVAGYRWGRFGWAYVGYDLNTIESFYCMP